MCRKTWQNFFLRIQIDYRDPDIVPYHNRLHATQVLATTYYLVLKTKYYQENCEIIDFMTMIIASAVHDVGHCGRSNEYLSLTNNDLAITYNDIGVMENYHCAHAFRLMKWPELNILG